MLQLTYDIRHAWRGLARRPLFTLAVLLTMALGVGANTAIFSLVRAVILRPLPYAQPNRLVHIYENSPKGGRFTWGSSTSYIVVRPGTLHEWRTQSTSFESIEAIRWRTKTLSGGDRAEAVWANEVTEAFFETAGVAPALGRTLTPDDYASDVPRAVVLSDRLWRTRYGTDPGIIGRSVVIDGNNVPVVGVMPPGVFPNRYRSADLWLPYWSQPGAESDRVSWSFTTLARLKPGVTFEQAHREMDVISDRLTATYPHDYGNMDAVLVPVAGEIVGIHEQLFFTLLGAVGLVLLVGCVNVANLMLVRATERRHELAVRIALGAGRRRLVRQVLTESVMLAAAGGVLGLGVAWITLPAALALLPASHNIPRLNDVSLDWAVLGFAVAISLLAGILFSLAAAFRASQARAADSLKEQTRGSSQGRSARAFMNMLVAAEVAVSFVVLVGAVLLLRSFVRLQAVESGFDVDGVVAMDIIVPTHRYGAHEVGGANPSRARLYAELVRELGELPGVEAAAMTASLPLKHGPNPWSVSIEGRGPDAEEGPGGTARRPRTGLYHHGDISIERVTPGYFRTLGVQLLRGRLLDERDIAGAPLVTLVNETFARRFFPDEDPLGRKLTVDMTSYFPTMTIVGVVEDNKMHGLDHEPYPLLYWSMAQLPSSSAWLVVRMRESVDPIARAAQATVARYDSDLAIKDVAPMRAVVAESIWRQRFTTLLLAAFGMLALLLASAGIYAVIAYSVAQRTREMGLRLTLGASPRDLITLIVAHGARLTLAGIAIGIAASLALRQTLASHLFGVSPSDPVTILSVSGALTCVALVASAVPAVRALKADLVRGLHRM